MFQNRFKNKKILVTAGATRETLDNGRYISNYDSGKEGYAIAEALLREGARVVLVSAPVNIQLGHPRLHLVKVTTAREMDLACCQYYESIDIAIFAASVAGYRPVSPLMNGSVWNVRMVENTDIAYEFGKVKTDRQVSIGFVKPGTHASGQTTAKLIKKNLDMIIVRPSKTEDVPAGRGRTMTMVKSDLSFSSYPVGNKADFTTSILAGILELTADKDSYDELTELALYETMYQ